MRLRVLVVLSTVLALAVGVSTATAGTGDKNLCKNGGWQTVFRADGSSFKNETKCLDYLRTGGKLSVPKIQVGIFFASPSTGFAAAKVTGTGFQANTLITFKVTGPAVNTLNDGAQVFSDANGAFNSETDPVTSTYIFIFCSDAGATLHVTATDGVHTGVTSFTIPAC
jgi:hypothetical protein